MRRLEAHILQILDCNNHLAYSKNHVHEAVMNRHAQCSIMLLYAVHYESSSIHTSLLHWMAIVCCYPWTSTQAQVQREDAHSDG